MKMTFRFFFLKIFLCISLGSFTQTELPTFNLTEWRIFLPDSIYDIDSNVYHAQQLGSQVWMVENLSVTRFNNGDEIPVITNNSKWSKTNEPACSDLFGQKSGKYSIQQHDILYNGYVATDERNVCPIGWHVPTVSDWTIFTTYMDSLNLAWNEQTGMLIYFEQDSAKAIALRERYNAIDHENQPYLFFTGSLNGSKTETGEIDVYASFSYWWCSDSLVYLQSWYGVLDRQFMLDDIYFSEYVPAINTGFSIRCIKD